MFRYDDDEDYYDRPDPVLERGCTCWSGSVEPCRYCQGEYPCEGVCGALAGDCQCSNAWDNLSDKEQLYLIREAFEYLCDRGEVPYGIMVGDDDTWDTYSPAIQLAEEWYNEEVFQ